MLAGPNGITISDIDKVMFDQRVRSKVICGIPTPKVDFGLINL